MGYQITWHSQQGTRTADNRDHAGVGIRGNSILIIVLDGSTSGPTSGQFAHEISRRMVDWFVAEAAAVTAETMTEQLRAMHIALAENFPYDSASYALLYVDPAQPVLVLHAGDCLVGSRDDGRTTWILQPHTLENALTPVPIEILGKELARHVLTRSYRSKRFIAPELTIIELDDRPLLIGTDGFWAELDEGDQIAFVEGDDLTSDHEHDDRSVLSISWIKPEGVDSAVLRPASNLYLRKASG